MEELINNIVNCQRVREISKLRYEVFVVLYIFPGIIRGNSRYDSTGTPDKVYFPDVNSVVANCREHGVGSVLLLHNHPYYRGIDTFFKKECSPEPSESDITSTLIFADILKQCGISVVDHIIVCPDESYFSFKQNGLI